jgi:hypothetical protein
LYKYIHIKINPMKPNTLPNEVFDDTPAPLVTAPLSVTPHQVRAQVFGRLSVGEHSTTPEKANPQPEFIGTVLRVHGRGYGLTEKGMVYDFQSRQFVDDVRIRDQVFDRYEEDLRTAEAIRRKAQELAHGDPYLEGAFRLHFAFEGLPQDKSADGTEATV